MGEPTEGSEAVEAARVRVGGERSLAQFSCEQCGAKLEYAPGTTVLRCPYCSHENQIPAPATPEAGSVIAELDLRAALQDLKSAAPTVDVADVECGACKAVFLPAPGVTATACPFCGTNLVLTKHHSHLIKPKSVLPFAIGRDDAVGKYRAWIKSRWFAPTALRLRAMLDSAFNGMYLPAWTYDAKTTTKYTGQRGDAYYVTVGSGKNRRTERRIRWSHASGVVGNTFDDVLVMATKSLPEKRLDALEPWDLKNLVAYDDAYLAGFGAEAYSVDLAAGFVEAQGIMTEEIRSAIHADIGGDEQRIDSMNIAWRDLTFKHLLLPVWVNAYRFRNRTYRILVNARTGEVQGERPYSWIKITLAVLAALTVAIVVVVLVSQR